MYLFYVFALIPVVIALGFFLFTNKLVPQELLVCALLAFFIAGLMHLISYVGMTSDTEIWSGRLESVTHNPEWVEEYQQRHARHNSKGEETSHYYTTEHRRHYESFEGYASYGSDSDTIEINAQDYLKYSKLFGGYEVTRPHKSGFDGGDPNVYVARNKTGIVVPLTKVKNWTNKVKSSPSTFSYDKVPENIKVFPYPSCPNPWTSDRLLGDARSKINIDEFDKMNTLIGLYKKGNVIIVGFDSADAKMAKYQESAWLGGKKNDIVICYGYAALEGNTKQIVWTKCFSWCENEQFKKNVEELFMTNTISTAILAPLYKEVDKNFVKKNWDKMDYLTVKPSKTHWWVYSIIMLVVLGTTLTITVLNDINERKPVFYRWGLDRYYPNGLPTQPDEKWYADRNKVKNTMIRTGVTKVNYPKPPESKSRFDV